MLKGAGAVEKEMAKKSAVQHLKNGNQ
jgi:hypothetical protein